MRKSTVLALLFIAFVSIVFASHLLELPQHGWTRVLLAIPIMYAGIYYRLSGSISVAMLTVLAQGPLIIIRYSREGTFNPAHSVAMIAISVVSVVLGHIMRKEKETYELIELTHNLIGSMRKNIDKKALYGVLESFFAERSGSSEVFTYLFSEDGLLRKHDTPDCPPLPPDHLFYSVAKSRNYFVSINPSQDERLIHYGPEEERHDITLLAVFPIEYGGIVRGVVGSINSPLNDFSRETVGFLLAIKKCVENTLELDDKLSDKIHHELQ